MKQIMIPVLLALMTGACGRTTITPVAAGPILIDSASGPIESRFTLSENASGDSLALTIDAPVSSEVWSAERGQTRPTAIYSKYFPSIGHLLIIESEDGASMLRLTLIRLSAGGDSKIMYDNRSRFGWNIVDLDGDLTPEIIQTSGDLGGLKTMVISRWDGENFVPKEALSSTAFAEYEIVIHP